MTIFTQLMQPIVSCKIEFKTKLYAGYTVRGHGTGTHNHSRGTCGTRGRASHGPRGLGTGRLHTSKAMEVGDDVYVAGKVKSVSREFIVVRYFRKITEGEYLLQRRKVRALTQKVGLDSRRYTNALEPRAYCVTLSVSTDPQRQWEQLKWRPKTVVYLHITGEGVASIKTPPQLKGRTVVLGTDLAAKIAKRGKLLGAAGIRCDRPRPSASARANRRVDPYGAGLRAIAKRRPSGDFGRARFTSVLAANIGR